MEKETNQNIESLKENATSGGEPAKTMETLEVAKPSGVTESVGEVEPAESSETVEALEPTEQTETSQSSSPSTISSGRKKHSLSSKILIASLVVFALISLFDSFLQCRRLLIYFELIHLFLVLLKII